MAGGFAVTKEPGTDPFASRFNQAGFGVLAFDYRCFGESGGRPRQVARMGEQLADWRAAIACAAGLQGAEPAKPAIWGFPAPAAMLSGSPRVTRAWLRQLHRRQMRVAWLPCATRPATSSRSRCCASPAAAFSMGSAAWLAGSPGSRRWPGSRERWPC